MKGVVCRMKTKLEKPSAETMVRTIALAVVMINQCLIICGREALPFAEDEIYSGVSAAASVIVSLWAWWKNNSFTAAAKAADALKDNIKE